MQSPSQNTADNKTAADVSESTAIPQQAQTEKIEALLESVNSASQHVRNYYITFLLAGFYIAMIVWSTTDLMLLKDTPVNMPLLNVELPITGFYTFAPYFFLLLHFNLLLQFSLLAGKVHRFNRAAIELQDADNRRYYYSRLFAFAFTQTLSDRHHSRLLRFLLMLMVWLSAIWLPLGILIGLQVGFLAYHSEEILSWQRMAIMLDLLVLFIFWPIIRSPDGNGLSWIIRASGISLICLRVISWLPVTLPKKSKTITVLTQNNPTKNSGNPLFEGALSLVTLIGIATFSWAIAVLPDSRQEKWVAQHISDHWKTGCKLSSANENGERYFRLTEFLFDGRKSAMLKDENGEDQNCDITATRNIFNRNLIIREQLLIANELKAEDEADLTSKDETVRQAALKKVTDRILSDRDLRYADFSEARLPKVDFVGADDKPSNLSYANFSYAMLVDARMKHTKLQGTDLSGAQLQGADLRGAQFQGAILNKANLNYSDITDAEFGFLTQPALKALQEQQALEELLALRATIAEAIHVDQLLWLINNTLANNTLAIRAKEQASIFAAAGKDVWENPSPWSRTRLYGFWNGLEATQDKSDYQNKLAAYLLDLSCRNQLTATGIIQNRIEYSFFEKSILLDSSFAKCLLSLKDQKNKAGRLVCPAMSKIDEKTVAILEEVAISENSDSSIQPTFACQTKLSDKKQPSE